MNGATIGAGWERQIAPGWTMKGEGRYTRFDTAAVTSNRLNAFRNAPFNPFFTTLTSTTTQKLSADMWSTWLGVTRYFN